MDKATDGVRLEALRGAGGELVTETFAYDGGWQGTVYVPPDPPEAVVFAGDGQLISQSGGVLEAADVPSTMIVGVLRLADETLRVHEYSLGFGPPEATTPSAERAWSRTREGRSPSSAPAVHQLVPLPDTESVGQRLLRESHLALRATAAH